MMNNEGRPTRPAAANDASSAPDTFSGARALEQHEPLIFERSNPGTVGVDLPDAPDAPSRLGTLARKGALGLPELSEPQVVRHYTRLSQYELRASTTGLYPARLLHHEAQSAPERDAWRACPDFADLHPMQPVSTVQGRVGSDRNWSSIGFRS